MRRWARVVMATVGVALLATALLVWRLAEQALGPAPEVHTSDRGGMSWCVGLTSCDPPELSGGTVAVIVALAVAGVGVLAAVVVNVVRRRRVRPVRAG
jgi:hypothetical protein